MDFISKSFPANNLHIQLWLIKSPNEKLDSTQMEERRTKLNQLMNGNPDNLTLINARLVASLMHINIAVSKALINKRDGCLKANNLSSEVVFHMSNKNSIQLAFNRYGVKGCEDAFFAVYIDMSQD